jgi:hypothetical protein
LILEGFLFHTSAFVPQGATLAATGWESYLLPDRELNGWKVQRTATWGARPLRSCSQDTRSRVVTGYTSQTAE